MYQHKNRQALSLRQNSLCTASSSFWGGGDSTAKPKPELLTAQCCGLDFMRQQYLWAYIVVLHISVYRCSTRVVAHCLLEVVSDSTCGLRNSAHNGHQTLIDVSDIGSQDLPDALLVREACHEALALCLAIIEASEI